MAHHSKRRSTQQSMPKAVLGAHTWIMVGPRGIVRCAARGIHDASRVPHTWKDSSPLQKSLLHDYVGGRPEGSPELAAPVLGHVRCPWRAGWWWTGS